MSHPSSHRRKVEVAARREDVGHRYLRGESMRAIGAAVGVTATQVFRDLDALRADWVASAVRDVGERTAEELAKLDAIEAAAWEGFARSQAATTVTYAETRGDETKAGQRTTTSAGDASWLAVALHAHERRCKLLGLDKPVRLTVDIIDEQAAELARATGLDKTEILEQAQQWLAAE